MAPKKQVSKIAAPQDSQRGRTDSPSQRGKKKSSARGTDDAKKKKSTKKLAGLDAVAELEPLESIEGLVAPVEALVTSLRAELEIAQAKVADLDAGLPAEDAQAPVSAPPEAAPPPMVPTASFIDKRTKAVRVWKNFANARLAEMASSLEAALHDDTKLRQLFDHMDADLGGSIDKGELKEALTAAGKKVSDDQLEHMFSHADTDGGGDIDYDEFADVVKGVKAAKAAFVIERGVRRHQDKSAKRIVYMKLGKAELEKCLRKSLLSSTPKALLTEWDRKKTGRLTRIEFRQGARNKFEIDFENRDLDEWFDKFDKNKDGDVRARARLTHPPTPRSARSAPALPCDVTAHARLRVGSGPPPPPVASRRCFPRLRSSLLAELAPCRASPQVDLSELKDAFRGLAAGMARIKAEAAETAKLIEALGGKIAFLESKVTEARGPFSKLVEEEEALAAHKALPHLDAKVGAVLHNKIKSATNPKGILSFEDGDCRGQTPRTAVAPTCFSLRRAAPPRLHARRRPYPLSLCSRGTVGQAAESGGAHG